MSNNESERINALFDEKKSFLVKILHERIESELRKLQSILITNFCKEFSF